MSIVIALDRTATEYLLTGVVSDTQPITNVRLLERFRALARCEPEEQEAVIRFIGNPPEK